MKQKTQRRIFTDDIRESEFRENGYTIISINDNRLLDGLTEIYNNNLLTDTDGLQLSLKSKSLEQKICIHNNTTNLLADFFVHNFLDLKTFASGFITKTPGVVNVAGLHRDPSFTDEKHAYTLLFWCPLTDTDETNGAIGVIPESNKIFNGYKGMVYGKFDFAPEEKLIEKKYGKILRLNRGEAVVFDTALLHFSGQNITPYERVVFSCFLIPKEVTPVCYHYNNSKDTIDCYKICNEEIFLNYYQDLVTKDELPFGFVKSERFSEPIKIGLSEFEHVLKEYKREKSKEHTTFKKIERWFKSKL